MARRSWHAVPATDTPLAASLLNDFEARKPEVDELPANAVGFGADRLGTIDATATIQARVDANSHTYVPQGTFRVDGTITLGAGKTLELAPGCTLRRSSTYTAATTPLVRLNGSVSSQLIGSGRLDTNNASPNGVVHIGPATQTVTTDVGWWLLQGVTIVGVRSSGNIGVNLTSSQVAPGTGSGAGSNYNGLMQGCFVSGFGTAVLEGELCNAHTFAANFFSDIGNYVYRLAGGAAGTQENTHYGGFTHNSPFSITILKLERALMCSFFGVAAEPQAGAGAIYYAIDANCTYTTILGHGNTVTDLSTDAGYRSMIIDRGRLLGTAVNFNQPGGSQIIEFRRTTDSQSRGYMDNDGSIVTGPGNAGLDTSWYRAGVGEWGTTADIRFQAAGKGVRYTEGTNALMGVATLVAGTVVVATTKAVTGVRIFLSRATTGGTVGHLSYTISSGTSFTINSSSGTDTSTVNWLIIPQG